MPLPSPTADLDRAEVDLLTHGYCIVADALSEAEVASLRGRLVEQAAAERRAGLAYEFGELSRDAGGENFTIPVAAEVDIPKH